LYNQIIIDTVDKDFIPNVNLGINKLWKDINENNIKCFSTSILGKSPLSDINLLKLIVELYKEAEKLGKHHRIKTFLGIPLLGRDPKLTLLLYTIIILAIVYITAKYSFINKCVHIFKLV